ncbi:MAG: ATP synthase F1 subunit delta [Magnetococcales bacterium]|nr:ATP synthase F1 subunit delta [Magnetococcales bacterium]
MHESTLAKRYANALADLASERELLEAVGADLTAFEALWTEVPGLEYLLVSPTSSEKEQAEAVETILSQASYQDITGNFLRLLVEKRRMMLFPQMRLAYQRALEERSGRLAVEVRSPKPLLRTHITGIQTALAEATGRQVDVEAGVDPALLGGMVVQVGSVMMDFSVRSQLNRLKAMMRG